MTAKLLKTIFALKFSLKNEYEITEFIDSKEMAKH